MFGILAMYVAIAFGPKALEHDFVDLMVLETSIRIKLLLEHHRLQSEVVML